MKAKATNNNRDFIYSSLTKKQASKITQRKRQKEREQELDEEFQEWEKFLK